MEPIEQVFLHVRSTDRVRSAEVAAATEFIRTVDLTEIVAWFSEREDEAAIRFDTLNVFFHPLPSGCFALGLIYPAQSGFFSFLHPPKSFFVRVLVVPPRTLLEKGNNPLALFEELRRHDKLPLLSKAPKRLHPLVPSPSVSLVDRRLLTFLASDPGPVALAALNQSLFDTVCTLFLPVDSVTSLKILDGLLNLLPLHFRTELAFSTELFFSSRYPMRLVGLGGSRRLASGQAKMLNVPMLALDDFRRHVLPPDTLTLDPWSRFVFQLLRAGDWSFLERQLTFDYRTAKESGEDGAPWRVNWEDLHELGAYWSRNMREGSSSLCQAPREELRSSHEALRCMTTVDELLPLLDDESQSMISRQDVMTTALTPLTQVETNSLSSSLAHRITRFPQLKDVLVKLDSGVARALFGDESTLPSIRDSWRDIRGKLAWDERDRLREEYLGLIRSLFTQHGEQGQARQVERSPLLLDLMLIFLDNDAK